MLDKRPQAERILVARLTGEARRRAAWRELTPEEKAASVVALRELAGGRVDLLAEVAGVALGFAEGQLDEPLACQVAALCLKAGTDPAAMGEWAKEGRRRGDRARMPPPSGGVRPT